MAGGMFADIIMRRLLKDEGGLVIDVGGGTGRLKGLLPAAARHVCVDVDALKLSGYTAKYDNGMAVFGDGLRLPLRSAIAQLVLFVAVSHHLTDDELTQTLAEMARVQAPSGTVFFCDALLAPERLVSRLLWRNDRGAHPRTAERLLGELRRHFRIVEQFEYTIWHRYLVCRCQRL